MPQSPKEQKHAEHLCCRYGHQFQMFKLVSKRVSKELVQSLPFSLARTDILADCLRPRKETTDLSFPLSLCLQFLALLSLEE